ncbi:MAG: helix-turn-helix domain-containing protein [Ferruginibacter sp.]
MENVQMVFPMEPKEFWSHLKTVIEEVLNQKNDSILKQTSVQNPPLKKLLKVKEVCELFHVSKPTIYDWLKQGNLKSIKIESRRYFLWEDIEELIQRSGSNTGINGNSK